MIGTKLGPYEITAKLGEGGMGEVYRATDPKLKREVAIKVLPAEFIEDPERLERFEREAQLLAQLHHPNIASIFGLEESSGTRGLVMELVEGPTLADRLAQEGLSIDESLLIARQIAEALEAAHEKGIVHRDLKPQNVKASIEGKVKVLDFGLAKAMDPGATASSSAADLARSPTLMNSPTLTAAGTQLGLILGTAGYMAPEQARGMAVDKRADLWALGVILWEMLAGRRLFEGEVVSDLLASVLRQPIDWSALPPATPPAARRLLRRLLERNPKNRLHDAADARLVLADLEAGVADELPVAPPPVAGARRRELAAWALAALAIAAAGWLWFGRPSAAPPAPRVIRAALPLPDGVTIELDGERAGMPALSHDGTRVAVGAREGAGPMRIWVVELATGAARALPGTEEGYRPFWSPDDRTIGFFTWSDLATTPAEGGAVRRLARARDARGGSWSPNGTILYAPHQVGALFTIAAQGGEPRVATDLGENGGLGTHRFPSFLPDGERFVYLERLSAFGRERRAGVVLGRLGSTAPIARLLDDETNAQVVGERILFARDGALVTQALDLERNAVVGEPTALVGDLLMNLRFSYGVFSASDRDVVAFLIGRQSDLSQLVWRDRDGRRLGELGAPGILSGWGGLALSPDGRWAAVSRIEEGVTESDVWIYDLARGTETRLARSGTDDFNPFFAPDSTALVYGSRAGSGRASSVVRRDLRTGAESELIERAERYVVPMALTPGGDGLVSCVGDPDDVGIFDIDLRALVGPGEERTLVGSSADNTSAQLSPDGRWLAWASDESGQYEVYVAPFPGPGSHVQVSRAGGVQPRWNPRGGELFFKTPDNTLTAVPISSGSATFATGEPEPLFQIVEFLGWTYDVAPDGERFLVREPLAERGVSPITLLTDWTSRAGRR